MVRTVQYIQYSALLQLNDYEQIENVPQASVLLNNTAKNNWMIVYTAMLECTPDNADQGIKSLFWEYPGTRTEASRR